MLATVTVLLFSTFVPFVLGGEVARPQDCNDLVKLNHTFEGHYVVYPETSAPNRASIIYCSQNDGMSPLPTSLATRSVVKNCMDLVQHGAHSGLHIIYPYPDRPTDPVLVMCDMDTDGGGWTIFQHRYDGSEEFYRSWAEYEEGFGNPNTEHYLGNELISILTTQAPSELRIELEDLSGRTAFAHYESFYVDARNSYRLQVALYHGTAGDSFDSANFKYFSTFDADHDNLDGSCSNRYRGGWWYTDCGDSNLHGRYETTGDWDWMWWWGFYEGEPLQRTKMMTRPYCYSP